MEGNVDVVGIIGLCFSVLFGLPAFIYAVIDLFKKAKQKLQVEVSGCEISESSNIYIVYLILTNKKNHLLSFKSAKMNNSNALVQNGMSLETIIGVELAPYQTKSIALRVDDKMSIEMPLNLEFSTSDGLIKKKLPSIIDILNTKQ